MMVVMKALITRIGIVALLVCIWASGAMADDNYVYPPGAEPYDYETDLPPEFKRPNLYDQVDVPDDALVSAYDEFKGTYSKADPVEAVNRLRLFVLDKRLDKVRGNLDWAIAQGWDEEFTDLFRRAIAWGDEIWHSKGAYVWAQSKVEEDRSPHESHKWVRQKMELIARKKKYAPAIYDDVLKDFFNPESKFYSPLLAKYSFYRIADKGFEPALQQLLERHLTGHVLERDLGAAYYWLKRGEQFGFDVTPWRSRIEREVSEQDRAWAEKILSEGRYPHEPDFYYR